MKEILERKLALIEDRYIELDNMLMISDTSYILEYEYLRGQRDVLMYLLSLYIE